MLGYPVFIAAQHEDGRLEQFSLTVEATSPDDAMNRALLQYQPRYAGEEGWRLAAVVDELMATDGEEASKST